MMQGPHRGGWVIVTSFVIAFMLTALPLPEGFTAFRPEWVALVLIYWSMALPERVGVGVGWICGLLLDVMNGTLLGQHALALAIIAFLAIKLHQRIRVFPLWQQALVVLVLVAMSQMLVLWVKGITGVPPQAWSYWLPSIVSMAIWPWIFVLLRGVRRRFQVT